MTIRNLTTKCLSVGVILSGLSAASYAGVHVNPNLCTAGSINKQGTTCGKSCGQEYTDPNQQQSCDTSCCDLVIPAICPDDLDAVLQCIATAGDYNGKGK